MSTLAEYLDLHINLEEIPDYNSIKPEFTSQDSFVTFAGRFIQKLQQSIASNNKSDLLNLYEGDYAWGIKKYDQWMEAHSIEDACNIQIKLSSQNIYNELIYRLEFLKINQMDSIKDLSNKSWQNYQDIFLEIKQNPKIALPEGWISDIIDNFIRQFEAICQWKAKKEEGKNIELQGWTVVQIQKQLEDLYQKMIVNGRLKLPEQMNSSDLLGYFALINHFKLETLLGKFSRALRLIQVICLNHTIVFSKAFLVQMELFYYASFCYFMTQKYLQSVKLAETIAIFFQCYRAFIKESINEKRLAKLNEKILALWCLANIFEGSQPHDFVIGIIHDHSITTKERNYEEAFIDKYEKLSQFDDSTFIQLFNFAAVKKIDETTLIPVEHEDIKSRVQKLKEINLSSILKLYSRIQVSKMARFLKVSESDLVESLKEYGKSKALLMQTAWQKTILKSLIRFQGEYTVEIKDSIVYIQRQTERKDVKNYAYLLNGINDIAKNLAKI